MQKMRQDEGGEGKDRHQTMGHEFFGFGQPNGKEHEQEDKDDGSEDPGKIVVKNDTGIAQNEDPGKRGGSNEGDFAAGFEKAHEAA